MLLTISLRLFFMLHVLPNAFRCRTHRQRTQNYIKTLESEVVRLRASESSLMRQRDECQAQVEMLKNTLLLSNIPLPLGIDRSLPEQSPTLDLTDSEMASISYRMDDSSHQRLHVDWMPPPGPRAPPVNQFLSNATWEFVPSQTNQGQSGGKAPASLPDGQSAWMLLLDYH